MSKIGILVDSGSGINEEEMKGTVIENIPLRIVLEDGTDFKDTPENIKKYELYERIEKKEHISTSMASPGELMEQYESMLKKYDHILHITIPSNLSGMKDTAIMISKDEEFEGKVTVINHDLAANALKILALKFDKMVKEGITDIKKFEKEAQKASKEMYMVLVPGDIARLNKGGRTKSMLVAFLKMLKQKIMIQWGATPTKIAMARTVSGLFDKANKLFSSLVKTHTCLLVSTPFTNQKLIDTSQEELDEMKFHSVKEPIPNIYGAHAGVDTFGFVLYPTHYLDKK